MTGVQTCALPIYFFRYFSFKAQYNIVAGSGRVLVAVDELVSAECGLKNTRMYFLIKGKLIYFSLSISV